MAEHLIIFDTTLRDGEQSPGASMTNEEKMRIGRHLERLRVDVIEAGFPASPQWRLRGRPRDGGRDQGQYGLRTRAHQRNDVGRCGEVSVAATSSRAHFHRDLTDPHGKEAADGALPGDRAGGARGRWAREYTDDVEFSPEDAGRSDLDFLCRILEQVITAGATTINIPDTVGYTLPEEFRALIRTLRERVPNSDKVVGRSTATTISASPSRIPLRR